SERKHLQFGKQHLGSNLPKECILPLPLSLTAGLVMTTDGDRPPIQKEFELISSTDDW
ncbi:hypothetical protein IQ229_16390, partial [Nostoc cf. edaphicum LEGE 07299]|nr:hypothetical protein [Nostoc cf. edaphicum LEGE 07299]